MKVLNYNLPGWVALLNYLKEWGVDVSKITDATGDDIISSQLCLAIAEALEVHYDELPLDDKEWLAGHDKHWQAVAKGGWCLQIHVDDQA